MLAAGGTECLKVQLRHREVHGALGMDSSVRLTCYCPVPWPWAGSFGRRVLSFFGFCRKHS